MEIGFTWICLSLDVGGNHVTSRTRSYGQLESSFILLMNSQEAFRRFAQQVQRAGGQGGGGYSGGPGRFLAGGGLLAALIGGGLLLNAGLFNGASFYSSQSFRESCWYCLQLMVVTVPSSIRGKNDRPIRELFSYCLA